MRTETVTIPAHTITTTYYQFSELSEAAKEKVRQWYLDGQDADFFAEDVRENLNYLFPNSKLNVQFSLASCQGDGLNIYGDLQLADAFEHLKEKFTEKEQKFFRWVFREYRPEYKMPSNNHYCYCIADRMDFCENLVDDLESDCMRGIPWETIKKFEKALQEYFSGLCAIYEEDGYKFFYEIDDAELEEICDINGWEFLENGEVA